MNESRTLMATFGSSIRQLALVAFTAAALPIAALAQGYPSKPIHLVVPYPAGGGGDIHGRLIGERLAILLGQPVIVENKAGASGSTGSDYVAKAAPDGYTLLVNTNALAVSQIVSPNLPFNVTRDFAPLSVTMTSQNMLVARPDLPVHSVKELIAFAKANPGKLTYGSSGLATPMLSMELFKIKAGVDITFVPYKGDAPGINDLLGGHIDLYVTNILPLQPHVKGGKLQALAVTSRKRAASLPEVPTMEEAGVADFDVESWFGFFAPAATPKPIVDTLNAALAKIVAMPDVQQKMAETGGTAQSSSPEAFGSSLQSDVTKFGQIVKTAGIKID
ncbi:tripartite tricarboxylate transporter substrate binding protein [soil metagenome]